MTPSEKRFFRLEVSNFKGGETSYMEIFDFYETLEEFTPQIEKSFFIKMNIINSAPAKNYLLNRILKSLRSFHENKNPKVELMIHYQNALIYLEKGMFEMFQKEIEKMKKKAEAMELFLFQILARTEQDIVFVAKFDSERYKEAQDRIKENIGLLEEIQLYYELKLVKNDLYFSTNFSEYAPLKEEAVSQFLNTSEFSLKSFWCKFEYLKAQFIYNVYIVNSPEGRCQSLKEITDLFLSNTIHAKTHLLLLIDYFYAYLHALLSRKNMEEYHQERKKFQSLFSILQIDPKSNSREADLFYLHNAQLDLNFAFQQKEYRSCIDSFKEYLAHMKSKRMEKRIANLTFMQMFFLPIQSCVKEEAFEELTEFSNDFFNRFQSKEHPKIQKLIHLYELIAKYKLDSKFLKNEIRKKIYFFKSINEYDESTQLFIEFIRKLNKSDNFKRQTEIYQTYTPQFEEKSIDALIKWWVKEERRKLKPS